MISISEKKKYFNKDEFFTICKANNLMCTDAELDEIFRNFDRDDDGKINYLEFTHDLLNLPRPGSSKYMGVKRGRADSRLSAHSQQILQKLVVLAERAACPPTTLANMFKIYDGDGSGMIAYDEMMDDLLLDPDEDNSTELGEVPHEDEKGSIKQRGIFAPYLYGRYTY